MRWDDDPSSWALAVLLAIGMAGGILSPNPNQQPGNHATRVHSHRSITSRSELRTKRSEAKVPLGLDGIRPRGQFRLRFAVERTRPDSRLGWGRCPVRHALDSTLRSLPSPGRRCVEWSWRLRGARIRTSQED